VSALNVPASGSDLDLMAAVAARDAVAEEELMRRLAGRVRRITGFLCTGPADADDAAQAALLEILGSAGGFRVETSLERWADRIAVRTTLRLSGRERKRRHLLLRWLAPGALPWGRPPAAPVGERLSLAAFLSRLSPGRREAFVLHHGLELSVDEIAELMAVPTGTVKDRLVSARKQLRRLVEREARRATQGGQHDPG
jgi:RNA polymerase sigma-70 factor, ECF subfamily